VKFLKSFGEFWYDFIIGDDWKIAVAVVVAVAVIVGILRANVLSDGGLAILGGVLVVVAFTISLVIDVRPKPKK
jgi:hypothetical protein